MPAKKYHVELSVAERTKLEQMLRRGKDSARRLMRARILLKAADGLRDDEIAEAVETSLPTVERTRKRFTEVNLGALDERPRSGKKPRLDERGEARRKACCDETNRQLLADTKTLLVERHFHPVVHNLACCPMSPEVNSLIPIRELH